MTFTFGKKTISLRGMIGETNVAFLFQEACMLSRLSGQDLIAREFPSQFILHHSPLCSSPVTLVLLQGCVRQSSSWFSGCLSTLVTMELSIVLVLFIPLDSYSITTTRSQEPLMRL